MNATPIPADGHGVTYAVKFPGSEWMKLIAFGTAQLFAIIVTVVQMRADITQNSRAIQAEISTRQSADTAHDNAMIRLSESQARLAERMGEINGYIRSKVDGEEHNK